tara:strand:+ start:3855 stop:5513 length:1659 start_codon:yes stop_codon:yes gene_type:complete
MAKELSKVGISTGLDIEAHHVTQSVDAFTGLDAYDVTISGSLEVTGSISTDSTVYANALNLEGGNIQYYPANDLLKFGDNIKIGIGAGPGTLASDIEISSDGNEGYITSNTSNLTLQSGGGDTIIRNTKSGKNIILQPDETGGGASGGVLISGSSPNVSLDVRGPITGSSNISASGDIYGDNFIAANNITASANISASGYVVASNITSSGGILGVTISASNDLYVGDDLTVGDDITQTSTNSILTLGEYATIKTGVGNFLKYTSGNQSLSLNKNQTNVKQLDMFAAINTGLNLYEKGNNNVFSSSLNMVNRCGSSNYGEIAMNWDQTYYTVGGGAGSGTLYINNNASTTQGGGQTHFGSNITSGLSRFVTVHGNGSTEVNGYWGLKVASGGALQLLSDQAYKPTAGQWVAASDLRLKENIVTASIDLCYDGVKNLPLKYFTWKDEIMEERPLDGSVLGWIAQDVKKVFPKAVQTGSFTTFSTFTGSAAITGSNGETILKPGGRYQDVLAGSEIIEDRHTLQADQITKMMYGAIQKLQEKVEALEAQISGSNS